MLGPAAAETTLSSKMGRSTEPRPLPPFRSKPAVVKPKISNSKIAKDRFPGQFSRLSPQPGPVWVFNPPDDSKLATDKNQPEDKLQLQVPGEVLFLLKVTGPRHSCWMLQSPDRGCDRCTERSTHRSGLPWRQRLLIQLARLVTVARNSS